MLKERLKAARRWEERDLTSMFGSRPCGNKQFLKPAEGERQGGGGPVEKGFQVGECRWDQKT